LQRSIRQLLVVDTAKLVSALAVDSGTARIEVQSLLQHMLNVPRAWLLAHPEYCLDEDMQSRYDTLLHRRVNGEPLAYILGEREFFGQMFKVTPATLIPRPETELLVELALQRMPLHQLFRVLDLGAGSGAIALSIAHARPKSEVLACDTAATVLAVACENAQRLGVPNATFVQSDWYSAFHGQRFDLIVSNPPYVAEGDPHLQQGDLRFEPASALSSGADGLRDIRHIVTGAPAHLSPGGWLLLEHGYDQAKQVCKLMLEAGFGEIFSAADLAGIERVSGGRLP
jgi:release factor glutamine methyltransferase